jgi:hypothetical protein
MHFNSDGARKLGKVWRADGSWLYEVQTHLTGPQLRFWMLSQLHPDGKGGYDKSKCGDHHPITLISTKNPAHLLGPKHR